MVMNSKDQRLKFFPRLLKKYEKDIQDKMFKAVEDLEGKIHEFSCDEYGDIHQFDFNNFSLIAKWRNGEIDSIEALKQLDKMDFEQAAKSKLLKDMKEFREKFNTILNDLQKTLEGTLADVEVRIVPDVVRYLDKAKGFFTDAAEAEGRQVKILYGHVDYSKQGDERLKWREMTLDQSIKYIRANKLEQADEKHLVNKAFVTFNQWKDKTSDVAHTHWFLAPPAYRDVLVTMFDVQFQENIPKEKFYWLDSIEVKKNA